MVSERSERFERAIEKVMKSWEGKVTVLSALLSILEQYGWLEEKLVLDCYKMIKRLCTCVPYSEIMMCCCSSFLLV